MQRLKQKKLRYQKGQNTRLDPVKARVKAKLEFIFMIQQQGQNKSRREKPRSDLWGIFLFQQVLTSSSSRSGFFKNNRLAKEAIV